MDMKWFFYAWLGITLGSAQAFAARLGEPSGMFALREHGKGLTKSSIANPVTPLPPKEKRVQALAQVGADFDPAAIQSLGWTRVSSHGGFAVLEGEVATFHLLKTVSGISVIQLSRGVRPTMDEARRLSRLDGMLSWGPNPAASGKGYSGKGVLIGI